MTLHLLLPLLVHVLYFLHDEAHLLIGVCKPCPRSSITSAARARRRMRLSGSATTMRIVGLVWLSWAAQQARSWAWGPYNDDWKKHIQSRDAAVAAGMYRVVLPRNDTAPAFYATGNSSSSSTNGTLRAATTGTATVPLSTWTPPKYTNTTTNSSTTTHVDTDCGVSSPLYTLQISGADGFTFNEWWLKLSGNSVLFTSQKEKASSFGVNSDTQHLCLPRSSATQNRAGKSPLIAIVETRLDQGPLYFVDANRTLAYEDEYEPIVCNGLVDGGQLSCAWDTARTWSGCGLQLELGSGQDNDGTLNCSSISLNAFEA